MFSHKEFTPIPLFPERRRLKSRRTVGIAGALAIASLTGGTGQYLNGDPLFVPGVVADFATGADCPKVGDDLVRRVETTLDSITNEPESIGINNYHAYALEQAKKFGLTLVDIGTYIGALNESNSINGMMAALNDLVSEFSLEIEIPKDKELKEFYMSYQPVKEEELDVDKFKDGALHFMLDLQYIPVEVVKASGISKIKIVSSDEYTDPSNPSKKVKLFDGAYNEATTDLFLDLNGFYNRSSSFAHELAHGIDFTYCGTVSVGNDKEYEERNPWNFNYGPQRLDTQYSITATPYGSSGVIEDKAEALSILLKAPEAYSVLGPSLQNKIDLLLARLDSKVPNVSAYFASLAVKTY